MPEEQYRISDDPLVNQINYIDNITLSFYQKLREIGFFKDGILVIVGDHRRMVVLDPEEMRTRRLDSFGRVVCSFIGAGIDKGKINNTLLNHTDINTILNLIFNNCDVDFNNLALYNKHKLLGINESFATNVLNDTFGLILIRTQTKQHLLLTLHGNLKLENIEDPTYKKIVAYLILSSAWLDKKQHDNE